MTHPGFRAFIGKLVVPSALAAGIVAAVALPAGGQDAPAYWYAWSPKPTAPPPYTGPNRPIWRLSEVLAKHKGQASWSEDVIITPRWHGRLIQMAPGQKTRPQFYGDDRTVWVVWGGKIRFTMAGQKPFVAGKGFLVQAPYRVAYSLETVGNEPSLRFEVTRAGRLPSYPAMAQDHAPPPAPAGTHYVKVTYPNPPDVFTPVNRMYVDFFKDVVAAHPNEPNRDYVVKDGDDQVIILRGPGAPTPPPSNRGHFHVGVDEFWFILEGKMDYLIEGEPLFTANPGDIVFVPPGRWHRASWAGTGMATRLAFNTRPNLFHNYGENAKGSQR